MPKELHFVNQPDCVALSDGIDQDAKCSFETGVDGEFTGSFTLLEGFKSADYDQIQTPLVIDVSSIFTPRSVTPTSAFKFATYDKDGYLIDTHSSFFLGPCRDAERINEVRIIQDNDMVGASTVYDFLIKSPYPLYSGDVLTLTIPEEAGDNLSKTFKSIKGSEQQDYLRQGLYSTLIGVDGIAVTLNL